MRKFFSRSVVIAALVGLSSFGLAAPAQATTCISGTGQPVLQSDIVNNAVYTICDFRGWDFHGLSGSGIDFSISYLAGANFVAATFPGTIIGNNSSHSINFTDADLHGSDFRMADLSSSDFTRTNLSDVNLQFTHLDGANLSTANLTRANLNNTFLGDADLTGAIVTQAQLAVAVLNANTICPDGQPLGLHVDDCFSALKVLTPVITTPVLTADGFTFTVTNYNEYYTFTVVTQSGTATPTVGSPSGSHLPVTVTGVPTGTEAVVVVTSSIGSGASVVTGSTMASNVPELATTGFDRTQVMVVGSIAVALLLGGAIAILLARRRNKR